MSGVRQDRHTEDVQEQIQLPEARVPVPRGPSAQSVPVPGVRQRVLAAGQDEKSHEDRARVLHAKGHRFPASAVPIAAVIGSPSPFLFPRPLSGFPARPPPLLTVPIVCYE